MTTASPPQRLRCQYLGKTAFAEYHPQTGFRILSEAGTGLFFFGIRLSHAGKHHSMIFPALHPEKAKLLGQLEAAGLLRRTCRVHTLADEKYPIYHVSVR